MTDLNRTVAAFRRCVTDPYAYVKELKESGSGPVVGVTCSYVPEELILAAGAHPIRLFGESSDIVMADSHMQAYGCSLARTILEDAMTNHLDFIDVMVFPHTCDTMQRLSDIWRLNVTGHRHMDLLFPAKLEGNASREYLDAVLKRFQMELESALKTTITDDRLSDAIRLTNRIRSGLRRLYEHRAQVAESISGEDLSHIVRGAMIMDRREAADRIEIVADILESSTPPHKEKSSRKRILLSGGTCLQPDIHTIVEEQGAAVVWDDLCMGTRYFDGQIETDTPPIPAIGDRLFHRMLCPAKHAGSRRRIKELKQLVVQYNIEGVIFLLLKFCDPHAFDYPDLKNELDAFDIPNLLIEMENGNVVDGQTRTRIEAFLQMLNHRERQ